MLEGVCRNASFRFRQTHINTLAIFRKPTRVGFLLGRACLAPCTEKRGRLRGPGPRESSKSRSTTPREHQGLSFAASVSGDIFAGG